MSSREASFALPVVMFGLGILLGCMLNPNLFKVTEDHTPTQLPVQVVLLDKEVVRHPRPPLRDTLRVKGQPELSRLRLNAPADRLADLNIDNLNNSQMVWTLHSYLDNIDMPCRRMIRMGNLDDGGWEVCDDADVRPVPPCIIYSFGIGGDWTFDEDSSRLYGCHVYSFDPTIHLKQHDHKPMVHFFPWGLGGATTLNRHGWPLFTMADLRDKLGHKEKTIDIVKMDIEHSEWYALPNMLNSSQLTGVKQLLLEYHLAGAVDKKNALKLLQSLERNGWKRFYARKNIHCKTREPDFPVVRTMCYEVMYKR